jgi:hypothetical protein
MTRKDFNENWENLIRWVRIRNFNTFSCLQIEYWLGDEAIRYYRIYISTFLNVYCLFRAEYVDKEIALPIQRRESEKHTTFRELVLLTFHQEVIRSKIYLKF